MLEETFACNGKTYNITIYPARPDGKKYPILLLLHGNFGLGEPYGSQIKGFAESLAGVPVPMLGNASAGLGYVTAVPDYYSDGDTHTSEQDAAVHLATLAAAIQHVASRPDADPTRVGLIGYSLGAAIAMTHIALGPGPVKVLVDYFGPTKPRLPDLPLDSAFAAAIAGFPPTIIFHDAKDIIVPVDRSIELNGLFPSSIEHQLNVYVTEPTQAQIPNPQPFGNHAFAVGGHADVTSRNAAVNWLVKHMPPTGV